MGIVQWLTGTRAHGAIIDANAFAALTNLFYFSALFVYLRKDHWRSRQRYLFLAALALLQLAFFATLSRGGLLVFMVLLPISLWIARGHLGGFRRGSAIALCVAAAAFAVVHLHPPGHTRDWTHLAHDKPVTTRLMMWQSMWRIYKAHPLLGTGIGSFKVLYPAYRNPHETVSSGNLGHNDYLQFLQEQGPVGLAFLLGCGWLVLWVGWRLHRDLRRHENNTRGPPAADWTKRFDALGLVFGLVVVFGQALGNFIFYVAPITLPAGLFLGYAYRLAANPKARSIPLNARPSLLKTAVVLIAAIPIAMVSADSVVSGVLGNQFSFAWANRIRHSGLARYRFAAAFEPFRPESPLLYGTTAFFELKQSARQSLPQAQRQRLAKLSFVDYLHLIRVDARSAYGLSGLAVLVNEYPGLAKVLPKNLPKSPVALARRAVAYDPTEISSYFLLANLYEARGEDRKALKVLGQDAVFWFSIPENNHKQRIHLLEAAIQLAIKLHNIGAQNALAQLLLANDPGNKIAMHALGRHVNRGTAQDAQANRRPLASE